MKSSGTLMEGEIMRMELHRKEHRMIEEQIEVLMMIGEEPRWEEVMLQVISEMGLVV